MSSLQRYKKSGGFYQLLSLIETFGPQKKEKFLEVVDSESRVWGQALRAKMLTLERMFSWPDQVVIEIFKRMPVKSQAFAMQGMKEEQKAKIAPFLSASEQRRLGDVLTESQPKPEEIQATLVKMVELARKLLHDRELHAEKFDEGLLIPEDFESRLETKGIAAFEEYNGPGKVVSNGSGAPAAPAASAATNGNGSHTAAAPAEAPKVDMNASSDVIQLQKSLAAVLQENKQLKQENKNLKDKLDQIKRIA